VDLVAENYHVMMLGDIRGWRIYLLDVLKEFVLIVSRGMEVGGRGQTEEGQCQEGRSTHHGIVSRCTPKACPKKATEAIHQCFLP